MTGRGRETAREPERIFHIQPDQGIELRFNAKTPGPTTSVQKVNMRFDYKETFEAQRGTGYEAMLYSCTIGDATLFSRSDLVEAAWKIAQPILDTWAETPVPDFAASCRSRPASGRSRRREVSARTDVR